VKRAFVLPARPGAPIAAALLLLILLVLLGSEAPSARSAAPPGPAPGDEIPGQLVVGFDPSASTSQEQHAVNDAGGEIESRIRSIDAAVVSVDPSRSDDAAAKIQDAAAVDYVEPNYALGSFRLPNDRSFGSQWGLMNTGQDGGQIGADIHAPVAWDLSTGGPVVVAVVDTGVALSHPELAGNLWVNPDDPANGQDDDGDGYTDDVHGANLIDPDAQPADDAGHGSHVAGIIGAQGGNGVGISGVDWDVQLMPVKFLDANGGGSTAIAATAIDYAVHHGARVINASWGGPAFSFALYQAVKRAGEQGALVVAAAGNDGINTDSEPDYPAGFDLPNVISVAASNRSDRLADFSNYGAGSVDLAAPGEDIYSTVPTSEEASGYSTYSGTSMAAPFVSGAAALYLSRNPQASVTQTRAAILQTVDKLPSFTGRTVTGGRLNLARLVGAKTTDAAPARDRTAPSPFALVRPRNRQKSPRRSLRFVWQRARDAGGILRYRVFVDGRQAKTVKDKDGPGGKDPKPDARMLLGKGRHRWFVRAYDYAGNHRTSKSFKRSRGGRSGVLYVGR
jgi:subtilisin family serine protease